MDYPVNAKCELAARADRTCSRPPTRHTAGLVLMSLVLCACQTQPAIPPPVSDANPAVVSDAETARNAQFYTELKPEVAIQVNPESFTYTGRGTLRWDGQTDAETTTQGRKLTGTYTGEWVSGKRQGHGEQRYSNGDVYAGDWFANQRQGEGTLARADGSVYSGAWEADQPHGYGQATDNNHVRYTGTWIRGQRHGYGAEVRPDQTEYEGQWQAGVPHGDGQARLIDGSQHNGEWQAGYILGHGTRTDPLGSSFAGIWNQNAIANGLVSYPDGSTYAGALFKKGGTSIAAPYLEWLSNSSSAEVNSAYAQYYLATAYLDYVTPEPDILIALPWLESAASQGLAHAQYRLAEILEDSDMSRAIRLYQQATAQQHAGSQTRLGQLLTEGIYVPQDLNAAVGLLQAAIGQGDTDAVAALAWLHATTPSSWADPKAAVELMQPLTSYSPTPARLQILAAAHARLSRYELAVSLQSRAIDAIAALATAATDTPQLTERLLQAEERLERYQAQQPTIE